MGAMNQGINTRNVPAGKKTPTQARANIVQIGAPKKQPEKRTKETSRVEEATNKINNSEEDRQLAGEETPRCREETTPPSESWTALIDEENSRELQTYRHQENTCMDTESIACTAEEKGEGRRVNEGSTPNK